MISVQIILNFVLRPLKHSQQKLEKFTHPEVDFVEIGSSLPYSTFRNVKKHVKIDKDIFRNPCCEYLLEYNAF